MKKVLTSVAIVLILIVLLFTLTACGNKNEEQGKSNQEGQVEQQPNDSLILEGVEYIDTSKNFKEVTSTNLSFYIDSAHENYLTYVNNTESPRRVEFSRVHNNGDTTGAIFLYHEKKTISVQNPNMYTIIMVSNENYAIDGIKVMTDNKTLIEEGDNYKFYKETSPATGKNMYQYVTTIDGLEVCLYCSDKQEDAKKGSQEICKYLSKNGSAGFYIDWYLSYDGLDGLTLNSYKKVICADRTGDDKIILGDHILNYSQAIYTLRGLKVSDKIVDYSEINGKKLGYAIDDDSLAIYLYDTQTNKAGETVYNNPPQALELNNFTGDKTEAEKIVELYKNALVTYEPAEK